MHIRYIVLVSGLLCSSVSDAQQPSKGDVPGTNPNPPVVQLRVQTRIDLPATLPPGFAWPVHCGDDGTIYAQFISQTGATELVGISPKGEVTRFSLPNDTRVQQGYFISAYPTGNSVMVHLVGQTDSKMVVQQLATGGRIAQRAGPAPSFVATFDRDGSFKKLLQLEVPFEVGQVAPFRSGALLVSGRDTETNEPRVALADEDGRFIRNVHLEGDITEKTFAKSQPKASPKDRPVDPNVQFAGLLQASSLFPDGDGVVLIRNQQVGAPLFAIAPSGEVRVVRPQAPDGYAVFSIVPGEEGWITTFSRKSGQYETAPVKNCVVDRYTGEVRRCYTPSEDMGFGFACYAGADFRFLKYNVESKRNQVLVASPE